MSEAYELIRAFTSDKMPSPLPSPIGMGEGGLMPLDAEVSPNCHLERSERACIGNLDGENDFSPSARNDNYECCLGDASEQLGDF